MISRGGAHINPFTITKLYCIKFTSQGTICFFCAVSKRNLAHPELSYRYMQIKWTQYLLYCV